jgi:hypothetical protein
MMHSAFPEGDLQLRRRKTRYEISGRECGAGWNDIVQPLCDDLLRMGGSIRQIKEKFGALVFAYSLPKTISERKRQAFRQRVWQAEAASLTICQTCGTSGELVNDKGYLIVACATCRQGRQEPLGRVE